MKYDKYLFRASQLGNLMTRCKGEFSPKHEAQLQTLLEKGSKSKKVGELQKKKEKAPPFQLSKGGMSFIKKLVDKDVYEYDDYLETKEMQKGLYCEEDSIALYNSVMDTFYIKNEERKQNAFITGECDIDTGASIVDIKTSWNKKTFPKVSEDIDNKNYGWQLTAYMWLWGYKKASLAYCLVDTPTDLIPKWEPIDLHEVSHLPANLRVTTKVFELDEMDIEYIKFKIKEARKYANWYFSELKNKNK